MLLTSFGHGVSLGPAVLVFAAEASRFRTGIGVSGGHGVGHSVGGSFHFPAVLCRDSVSLSCHDVGCRLYLRPGLPQKRLASALAAASGAGAAEAAAAPSKATYRNEMTFMWLMIFGKA